MQNIHNKLISYMLIFDHHDAVNFMFLTLGNMIVIYII